MPSDASPPCFPVVPHRLMQPRAPSLALPSTGGLVSNVTATTGRTTHDHRTGWRSGGPTVARSEVGVYLRKVSMYIHFCEYIVSRV